MKNNRQLFVIVGIGSIILTMFIAVVVSTKLLPVNTENEWIGYYGAILGGLYTLVGVKMTIDYSERGEKEKLRYSVLPVFNVVIKHNEKSVNEGCDCLNIVENGKIETFCLHITNIGLQAAKEVSVFMKYERKKEDLGTKILLPVNEKYILNLGAKVLKANAKINGKLPSYDIVIGWNYKDLIGNNYEQHCDIILEANEQDGEYYYFAKIKDIEEARFVK